MKKAACFVFFVFFVFFVLFALCAQANATPAGRNLATCAEDLTAAIVNNPFFGLMVMAVGLFVGLRWKRRKAAAVKQAKEQQQ